MPGVVKPAALAERRGQGQQAPPADREHGPNRAVEIVRHASGLVDDQQVRREAANGRFVAWQAQDASAVGQFQIEFALAARADRPAQGAEGAKHLAKDLRGLAQSRRKQQDELVAAEQGGVQGEGGRRRSICPIAGSS